MSFDISGVINNAVKSTNKGEGGEGGSAKHPYLNIQDGTLKVKFLFNPASGIVGRIYRRHFIDKTQCACLEMYGQKCPACDALKQIANATGQDMWKFKASPRAVSFVQYVGSSGYQWTIEKPEPAVGQICILNYPWSVYQDFNRIIAGAGAQASKLFAQNEGKVLSIMRYKEGAQTRYKCEVDAFAPEYKSFGSQEEYERELSALPTLNELQCPSAPNDEIVAKINELAATLNREFLAGVVSPAPATTVSQFVDANSIAQTMQSAPAYGANPVPFTPSPAPAPAQQAVKIVGSEGGYACIGNHNANNPRCVSCPKEAQCILICGENIEIPY